MTPVHTDDATTTTTISTEDEDAEAYCKYPILNTTSS